MGAGPGTHHAMSCHGKGLPPTMSMAVTSVGPTAGRSSTPISGMRFLLTDRGNGDDGCALTAEARPGRQGPPARAVRPVCASAAGPVRSRVMTEPGRVAGRDDHHAACGGSARRRTSPRVARLRRQTDRLQAHQGDISESRPEPSRVARAEAPIAGRWSHSDRRHGAQ